MIHTQGDCKGSSVQLVRLSSSLVTSLQSLMHPQNQTELLHFIGLVNYYRCFIPKVVDKMEPLLAIAQGEFSWSPLCQRVFDSLKAEIS